MKLITAMLLLFCALNVAVAADEPEIDRLVDVLMRRLQTGKDVACWKRLKNLEISDAAREKEVIEAMKNQAAAAGLKDMAYVESVARSQIEANKMLQKSYFDRWKGNEFRKGCTLNLEDIRQKLNTLGTEMVTALIAAHPKTVGMSCKNALEAYSIKHKTELDAGAVAMALSEICRP